MCGILNHGVGKCFFFCGPCAEICLHCFTHSATKCGSHETVTVVELETCPRLTTAIYLYSFLSDALSASLCFAELSVRCLEREAQLFEVVMLSNLTNKPLF